MNTLAALNVKTCNVLHRGIKYNMKNKLKYIASTLLLAASLVYGSFTAGDSGTFTGAFLKMGSSARGAAMGDAYSTLCEDASAVYYNPAGLNYAGNFGLSLMHAMWFEGVSYEWVGMNMSLGTLGKLGIGLQSVSYGSIIETDDTGLDTGSFTPSDLAISLSYAANIAGFDLGVTGKYISMTVAQSASTFIFDGGIIKKFNLSGMNVAVSLTGRNFGLPINFGTIAERLPRSIGIGVALDLVKNLKLSGEGWLPWDNHLLLMAGAEYSIRATSDLNLKIRAGYSIRSVQFGDLGGLTAGLGVGNSEYSMDYAFVPYGDLGYTHRVSFSVAFGKGGYFAGAKKFNLRKVKKVEEEDAESTNKAEVTNKAEEVKKVEEEKKVEEPKKEEVAAIVEPKQEAAVEKAVVKRKRIIKKRKMADGSTTYVTTYPEGEAAAPGVEKEKKNKAESEAEAEKYYNIGMNFYSGRNYLKSIEMLEKTMSTVENYKSTKIYLEKAINGQIEVYKKEDNPAEIKILEEKLKKLQASQ